MSRSRAHYWLHLGLATMAALGIGAWLSLLLFEAGSDPSLWQRDWYCLYSVGSDFLEQGAAGLYERSCADGYYWLYPPYVLYPYAAASLLPALVFYGIVVTEVILLTWVGLRLMARTLPGHTNFETLGWFVAGSAAFNAAVVTGQHSAILMAAIAGCLYALRFNRRVLAGACLGLLGLKPNWAALFVLLLLTTRRWRVLGTMVTIGAVMILSTAPLGADIWMEYLTNTGRIIDVFLDPSVGQPVHKLLTFEAFTRSTLGELSSSVGVVGWIMLELFAVVSCLVVWLRSSDVRHQLAIAVLAVVAGNVYVEFYDALVLAVPAAVWWTGREDYTPSAWRWIGASAGALWLWQWLSLYAFSGPGLPSLTGGFLAIWMAAEAFGRRGRGAELVPPPAPTPPTG